MTIRKRLAHSNIAMLVIPLLTAAVLVLLQMVWGVGYRLRKDNEPS